VALAPGEGIASSAWFSQNGRDWVLADTASSWAGRTVSQLVAWQGGYVAAGAVIDDPTGHVLFWQSSDGAAWTPLTDAPALAFVEGKPPATARLALVESLSVNADKLSAVGAITCGCESDQPIAVIRWTTSDLVHWIRQELATTFDLFASVPVEVDGTWVRAADWELEASTDKTSWHRVWPAELKDEIQILAVANTKWGAVAVGGDGVGALMVSSTDGLNWIQSTGWPGLLGGILQDVAGSDTTIVAVGGGPSGPLAWVSPPMP
jgi:hypothetical protein